MVSSATIYLMSHASGTQQEGQMFLIFIMMTITILLLLIYLMVL